MIDKHYRKIVKTTTTSPGYPEYAVYKMPKVNKEARHLLWLLLMGLIETWDMV